MKNNDKNNNEIHELAKLLAEVYLDGKASNDDICIPTTSTEIEKEYLKWVKKAEKFLDKIS